MTACGPFGFGPSPGFPQYLALVIGTVSESPTDEPTTDGPSSAAETLDELFRAHGVLSHDEHSTRWS